MLNNRCLLIKTTCAYFNHQIEPKCEPIEMCENPTQKSFSFSHRFPSKQLCYLVDISWGALELDSIQNWVKIVYFCTRVMWNSCGRIWLLFRKSIWIDCMGRSLQNRCFQLFVANSLLTRTIDFKRLTKVWFDWFLQYGKHCKHVVWILALLWCVIVHFSFFVQLK